MLAPARTGGFEIIPITRLERGLALAAELLLLLCGIATARAMFGGEASVFNQSLRTFHILNVVLLVGIVALIIAVAIALVVPRLEWLLRSILVVIICGVTAEL